ncbi:MAG: formylglycine-generating enzyme family protein [Leptospiraceae bacterium]|nr:formylglycine-generating enzyme family protein [Leptospiraceae bacterium]MCP5502719.1 formylglycine-generating enzyme family protein [Leptospiraceae bacterium]
MTKGIIPFIFTMVLFILLAKCATAGKTKARVMESKTVGGIEFVYIPGGCFQQGSESGDKDEKPVHKVCVKSFWMGKYEVTQEQWKKVMDGKNPSHFQDGKNKAPANTAKHPVEMVNWKDTQEFIEKFNALNKTNAGLPGESQWEYAARTGTSTQFYTGKCITTKDANYLGNSTYMDNNGNNPYKDCPGGLATADSIKDLEDYKTVAVGSFKPNPFGLHDMAGNVWEWTQDCYHPNYEGAPTDGSAWQEDKCSKRVLRGCCYSEDIYCQRSANRSAYFQSMRIPTVGFRLILQVD